MFINQGSGTLSFNLFLHQLIKLKNLEKGAAFNNMFINQGSGTLSFNVFLHQLIKLKNLEKGAAFNNKQKYNMFIKKCSIVENLLPQ